MVGVVHSKSDTWVWQWFGGVANTWCAGSALPETHHDDYSGGQGAEKLFLVLALLSCLHESRMAGSSLLKFRCFTEEPDFIFSGLFCN